MPQQFPAPKQTEIRTKFDTMPLTTLAGSQGFVEGCTPTDLVRASVYTCCYIQMLLNPAWRPLPSFRDECRVYADFLFKESLPIVEAGCIARSQDMVPVVDLDAPALKAFERSFLARLTAREAKPAHVHVAIPKGLWAKIRQTYGINHGATNAGFARLMAGLLYQVESIVTAADLSG